MILNRLPRKGSAITGFFSFVRRKTGNDSPRQARSKPAARIYDAKEHTVQNVLRHWYHHRHVLYVWPSWIIIVAIRRKVCASSTPTVHHRRANVRQRSARNKPAGSLLKWKPDILVVCDRFEIGCDNSSSHGESYHGRPIEQIKNMCRIPSHHGIIRASDYSVKNVFAAYQHVHTKILLISIVLYIYILYTYCTYKIRISLCAHRLESIPIMRPHLGLLRSSSNKRTVQLYEYQY